MEPDDSTGITMVSAPNSPPVELPNDTADDKEIFHTPLPRYRSTSNSPAFYDCNEDAMIDGGLDHDGEADNAGGKRVIDLGKEEGVDSAKKIESDSNPDGSFHMDSEGTTVVESLAEPLATGPKEEITEAETNSIKVSMNGKSLDVSTESIKCDTEIGKVECETDNGEGSSESDTNIVEDIDSAGTGSNSHEMEEKLKKITLLDVLQMLANVDPGEDHKKQAHLTLWEVAEARWGPF